MSPLNRLEYYSALKRRGALTLTSTWMDPESMVLSEGSRHRGHTGCDSTDGKHPEQADPQTLRVGSWLSEEGVRVTVDGASFGVLECSGTRL